MSSSSALAKKDARIPSEVPSTPMLSEHSAFILKYDKDKEDYEFVMSEFLRINAVYWALTAMDLMGRKDKLDKEEILAFVASCYHADVGGYSPSPGHDPHVLCTLSAVQIHCILDAADRLDDNAVADYVSSMQNLDGSFRGDRWGEVDTRFSFGALATLTLVGRADRIDLDAAVDFVASCRNFDGGFGSKPGSESHAGLIYCCVGFLALAGRLDLVDADRLGWWLAERQLPSGGLNGRPEKLPDVCYGWWVLSSLTILDRLHWIDASKMRRFILASQDAETGGISDRPGDLPDPFHTLFGVAGLSMLSDGDGVAAVNPVYCMPQAVVDRMGLMPQMLKM